MGVNKALLRMYDGGPTVVEMVVARLGEAGVGSPLLITNNPYEYAFLRLECVPDDVEGAGVLGGILTAVNHSERDRVLIVGCDMPLLSVGLLRYMMSVPGEYDVLVPRWSEGGEVRVEPLHAIYSVRQAGVIERQIAEGRRKVSDFLDGVDVTYLDESVMRQYDPGLRSFYNVNTPEEWERLKDGGGGKVL
jgi:molybdopterin-guanine dinucleotide biosynthesis protein A